MLTTFENGNKVYKIRLAVESKGKGKSGGMRVIYFIITQSFKIYLLTIYDKSEKPNISDNEILNLIQKIQ